MSGRKDEIILATLELASENGLRSVSMQQIADRVGITKASLYNHFSSKEEIVLAMYETLRQESKDRASITTVDYGRLASQGTMREVLTAAVDSYRTIVRDPQMYRFYTIIESERPIEPAAAEIMVKETQTMVDATRSLLKALEAEGKASFPDLESASFSFAMAIHSAIDYEFDLMKAGMGTEPAMFGKYIDEFCRIYGTGKD